MTDIKIIQTRDGSSSLLIPSMNETYHSTHGAVTEAKYVFLKTGLNYFYSLFPEQKDINILEIGFGTGLNAWLCALEVQNKDIKIDYKSLEKYPLKSEIISQLNYIDDATKNEADLFRQMHQLNWNSSQTLTDNFDLSKMEVDIFDYSPKEKNIDLIFFDAFAPSKQPEMWTPAVMEKMFDWLNDDGVLVTYCAQGQFKRDLIAADFQIESLPGPPGKKEMTRATKLVNRTF